MPDETSIGKFLKAAFDVHETDITKALDSIFALDKRDKLKKLPGYADLVKPENANILQPLLPWAINAMQVDPYQPQGTVPIRVTYGEIDHINLWPNDPGASRNGKKQVRDAILQAIRDGNKLKFFWQLKKNIKEEDADIVLPDATNNTIKITFLSPFSRVSGNVEVAVGPEA